MLLYKPYYLLLLLLPISLQAQPTEKLTPFARFETTLFSEPVLLSSISNAWKDGNYRGGQQQFADLWIEAGVKKGNWGLSTLYRQRQQYDFNKETAGFYNILENTHNLTTGKNYAIELQTQRFTAKGLRGSYYFQPTNNLSLQVGASLFKTSNLMSGGMMGLITPLSSNDYNYQVDVDYLYNEDVLLDRPNVNAPKGQGYSLDLQLKWQATKRIGLSLDAKDILSAIYWDDVPRTKAVLTSNIKTVGSDGFVKIQPNLSGKEDYLNSFKQDIGHSGHAQLHYSLNHSKQTLLADAKFFGNTIYAGFGGKTKIGNSSIAASYYPQLKTLSLKYQGKKMAVMLGVDNIKLSQANTIWLGVEIN
ncbi:MAG: hypothetical protein KAH22_11960 [Thiotrichaceae bacterium]|nr:hypothetical protein [Thiotrichaceae bacterium]